MLNIRISSYFVGLVHASAPYMCMLSARISSKCLKGPLLSARISTFARSHFLPMALEGICPHQNHYVSSPLNTRYINGYTYSISCGNKGNELCLAMLPYRFDVITSRSCIIKGMQGSLPAQLLKLRSHGQWTTLFHTRFLLGFSSVPIQAPMASSKSFQVVSWAVHTCGHMAEL
jgi:hypothetical protein